jgi:hypothetical protein
MFHLSAVQRRTFPALVLALAFLALLPVGLQAAPMATATFDPTGGPGGFPLFSVANDPTSAIITDISVSLNSGLVFDVVAGAPGTDPAQAFSEAGLNSGTIASSPNVTDGGTLLDILNLSGNPVQPGNTYNFTIDVDGAGDAVTAADFADSTIAITFTDGRGGSTTLTSTFAARTNPDVAVANIPQPANPNDLVLPEPTSIAMFGAIAVAAAGYLRWRRKKPAPA